MSTAPQRPTRFSVRRGLTVGQFLQEWLAGKRSLRPSTHLSYATHVRLYLLPSLGDVPLRSLEPRHVEAMYSTISMANDQRHRSVSPATMQQPAVSETLKGIRRTLGTAQKVKAPLLTADIRRMVDALPDTLAGCRDRALLLLGFAGGFRRSELAALDVEDVKMTEDGLVVKLRRSKTQVAIENAPPVSNICGNKAD